MIFVYIEEWFLPNVYDSHTIAKLKKKHIYVYLKSGTAYIL